MNCNNCNQNSLHKKSELNGYNILECKVCKFELIEYHESSLAESATEDVTLTTDEFIINAMKLFEERKGLYAALADHQSKVFVSHIGKNLRILEIGCGVAGRAEHFIANGHLYTGIDLDSRIVKFVQGRGINCYQSDFKDFPINKFDVILCSQVLEHIKKPIAFIERVKLFLEINGIFQLDVPNNSSVISEYFKRFKTKRNRYGAVEYPHHLYGHCPSSMRQLLNKHFNHVKIFSVMPDCKQYGQGVNLSFYWFPIKLISAALNKGSLLVGIASDKKLPCLARVSFLRNILNKSRLTSRI